MGETGRVFQTGPGQALLAFCFRTVTSDAVSASQSGASWFVSSFSLLFWAACGFVRAGLMGLPDSVFTLPGSLLVLHCPGDTVGSWACRQSRRGLVFPWPCSLLL